MVVIKSDDVKGEIVKSEDIVNEFLKGDDVNVVVDWESTNRNKMSVYQGLKDYVSRNNINAICYISCGDIHLQRKVE